MAINRFQRPAQPKGPVPLGTAVPPQTSQPKPNPSPLPAQPTGGLGPINPAFDPRGLVRQQRVQGGYPPNNYAQPYGTPPFGGGATTGRITPEEMQAYLTRGMMTPPQMAGGMGGAMTGGNMLPGAQPQGPVDHMANYQSLMQQDPSGRLANEYRTRSGDTIKWWQEQGQQAALNNQFQGDLGKYNQFINTNSAQGGNVAPLQQAEMDQLNQMAGIAGPRRPAPDAFHQGGLLAAAQRFRQRFGGQFGLPPAGEMAWAGGNPNFDPRTGTISR